MHCKQGYALLNIIIILALTIIVSSTLYLQSLGALKTESIVVNYREIVELTDREAEFYYDFIAFINENEEYKRLIKERYFLGELSNYLRISGYPEMKMKFSKDFLYWSISSIDQGRVKTKLLQYEITEENKLKLIILNLNGKFGGADV